MIHHLYRSLIFLSCLLIFGNSAIAQIQAELITKPEKTQYTETSLYQDVMDFIAAIEVQSELVHMESMGKSLEGREIPVVVMANPKITTPEEAVASGKPVMYVQGNIHSGEVEGKEVLQILMREILLGAKGHLLDNQILVFAPIYNTDSNDKMGVQQRRSQEGSPRETGIRANSQGWDLNRDGMKMEALETNALIQNVILKWDPEMLVDLHTTNGTWHGYSLTWAPSYHYAGEKSPYDFTWNRLLPEVTESVLEKYNVHIGPYGYHNLWEGWPVTAIYTYNHHPRYMVNQMGLRNKIGILSEAFAHERLYQRMTSTHAFVSEILEFTNQHAQEMVEINDTAEKAAINLVKTQAGIAKKGVRFEMVYLENIPKYRSYEYLPILPDSAEVQNMESEETGYRRPSGEVQLVRGMRIIELQNIANYSGFKATVESTVPRGYLIPAEFGIIAEHLEKMGVELQQILEPITAKGEVFVATSFTRSNRLFEGHNLATIEGNFESNTKNFKPGDYWIDLAQPLANLIFYALEPQSDDGLLSWNFFDEYFEESGIENSSVEYPVFKYFSIEK